MGDSPAITRLLEEVGQAAQTEDALLVLGSDGLWDFLSVEEIADSLTRSATADTQEDRRTRRRVCGRPSCASTRTWPLLAVTRERVVPVACTKA